MIKLRKSAIGDSAIPEIIHPTISANITESDTLEIKYYWDHGVRDARKIGQLMGHSHDWAAKRLEVMGLIKNSKKRNSNSE